MGDESAHRAYPDPREPTPWAPGLTVSVIVGVLTAVAVYVFGIALTRVHPTLTIAVNLIAVSGIAPTLWRWRATPVLRWVIGGVVAGIATAWVVLVITGLASL
ncbi:DUF2537 domain-containing protein [Nocardia bovistercoris]|uniref:DUF2537 domain-containing protein n=1 Tax=Nocardia bovistercoris TaxID=2785916 RepID=A0A931N7A4_9NOCA|nr:DUF2537 domain-containing protein [Nocardia bovistercoris]